MKLRFLSPETTGRFLRPNLAFKTILKTIHERYKKALPQPVFHQSFVGDTLSLIYAPFYVDTKVYDAVLNRPVSVDCPKDFDMTAYAGGSPDWRLNFIAAQCPDCGWDLEGDKDSLVLHCRNCDSAWQVHKGRFIKLKFAHMPVGTDDEVIFLPLWRIRAVVSGIALNSYADMIRLANLPKVIRGPMEDCPFYFWSPAFKVRPQDFVRFSRRMTLAQPQKKWISNQLPKQKIYPVTLSIKEALEGLKTGMASFMKPAGKLYPGLPDIQITAQRFALIYIPFRVRGNELACTDFSLRINRNLLEYARRL